MVLETRDGPIALSFARRRGKNQLTIDAPKSVVIGRSNLDGTSNLPFYRNRPGAVPTIEPSPLGSSPPLAIHANRPRPERKQA